MVAVLTLIYQSVGLKKAVSSEPSANVVMRELSTVAGRWQWDPGTVRVPQGATVQLTINNTDPYAHGFAIAALGVDVYLPPHKTIEVTFVADLPLGEYDFLCSVICGAGHSGMRGTLIITDPETAQLDVTPSPVGVDTSALPVRSKADAIETLPFEIDEEGTKVFHLSVEEVMWDYGDGNPIYSWGYEGQLPGPDIRVTLGDRVRVIVTNHLPEPTTVHWHGIDIEWEDDGVPTVTQNPIAPGETYTYDFVATPVGTSIYHTHGSHHGDEAKQMDMGLAGPFIVEPIEDDDPPDQDIVWILTERIQDGLYSIDGAIFPTVPRIVVREGERIRVRMINAGSSTIHPMHLHGHQFTIVATDGNPVPKVAQLTRNVQSVLPGESYDVEFIANNPGHWLFHCHELQHAAGGMIADLIYEGWHPPEGLEIAPH